MEMDLITPLILAILVVKIFIKSKMRVSKTLGNLNESGKAFKNVQTKKLRRFYSLSMTFSLYFSQGFPIYTVLIAIGVGNE